MGKRGKKKFKKQNKYHFEDDLSQEPVEESRSIQSRLGWQKVSKKNRKKQNKFQKSFPIKGDDIEMMGIDIRKPKSKDEVNSVGWHRISLPHAGKYPKDVVLKALASNLSLRSLSLEPIAFKSQADHFSFHVESSTVASALKNLDKQINLNPAESFVLRIRVSPSAAPQMNLNDDVIASMKQVMSNRFNTMNSTLNLSGFHNDSSFLGHDVYVPLSRSVVLNNVIKIINENIPQVVAIDLSKNKMPTLDYFSTLEAPNLKLLNLEDNRLELRQLEKLSSLKLAELNVKGNPMMRGCENDDEKMSNLIDKIREMVPSLEILNGVSLPKRLKFVDDTENSLSRLPKSLKKLDTSDHKVNETVLEFVKQYFTFYDSDNREALLPAYHEKCMFSVSSAYPPGTTAHGASKLQEYQLDSRNLRIVSKPAKRQKLLKQDRLSVVAFLTSLPQSRHDFDSFTLDITFASAAIITFTVTGIFKEPVGCNTGTEPVRYFNRCFVVVPINNGLSIVNDILFVTLPTREQTKALEQKPASSGLPEQQQPVHNGVTPPPTLPLREIVTLVNTLAATTGMNQTWSRKCLEETQWNYDAALAAFQNAFKQSLIPAEAFVK